MLKLHALAAGAALVAAPLNAACWSPQDSAAAQVRDLQSMLMVAALRCHAVHIDITSDYNAFVAAEEPSIDAANDRIKAHFRSAEGPVAGQRDYDHFTTTLANAYGASGTTPQDCARAAEIAHTAAQVGAGDALMHFASETMFGSPVEACERPVMAGAMTVRQPIIIRVEAPAMPVAVALEAPVPVQWAAPANVATGAAPAPATVRQSAPVELASAATTSLPPAAIAH